MHSSRSLKGSLELVQDDWSQLHVRLAAGLDGGLAADENVLEGLLARGGQHAPLDTGGVRRPGNEDDFGAGTVVGVVVDVGDGVSDIVGWKHVNQSLPLSV